MITLPGRLLVVLAIAFSVFNAFLALIGIPGSANPGPVVIALLLYIAATALSLWSRDEGSAMPSWLAFGNVAVSVAMALLVSSTLDPTVDNGHSTWYVGAAGTLLTITAVRGRSGYSWYGVVLLGAQTWLWGGPTAVLQLGVAVNVVWIAAAYILGRTLADATRDVQQFARAEREAVEWRAMQDAMHFERQARLAQTSRMALPMLQRIRDSGGVLSDEDRHECAVLEQGIRDEIRGRRLLNAAVREQVMAARRRGAEVLVLDDGGVDDIDPRDLDPVLDRVAEALANSTADRWIIRTAPKGSERAVTVVGITRGEGSASALGLEDDDDGESVDVWLELDRPAVAAH